MENSKRCIVFGVIIFILFLLPRAGVAKSMQEHIQEELAPFSKITLQQLDATEKLLKSENHPFMRVKITGGNSTYYAPSSALQDYHPARINGYDRLFKKLAPSLPDLDLIIALDDSFNQRLSVTAPVFCISKLKTQTKVLCIPEIHLYPTVDDFYSEIDDAGSRFPWECKAEKAFWRGCTTGGDYIPGVWMHMARTRLVVFSKDYPTQLDCAFHNFGQGTFEVEAIMRGQQLFGQYYDPTSQMQYKYLIAIDGNSFPSALKWQLFSGSVVLKNESRWLEWFSYALIPFEHYIPYKLDFSDLVERILWLQQNDSLAKEIVHKANRFAKSNLTSKNIEDYVYTLLLAYSKLQKR